MEHSVGWTLFYPIKYISAILKGLKLYKICSSINGMKLEINNSRKFGEFTIIWQLNSNLNNQLSQEEITQEIRKYFGLIKMKTQHSQTFRMQVEQNLEAYL